jgi:type IV secretion system protein VirD4
MRRVFVAIGVVGAIATLTLCGASNFIASVFDDQPALGAPLLSVGAVRFYAPWSVLLWRTRSARRFPRPFSVADAILALGGLASVASASLLLNRKRAVRAFGTAAWAGFEDAREAGLFAQQGCVLGKLDGEILCFDGPEHQLLVGASRSGKGRGHVVPTLLAWPGSVLALDVKGELDVGEPRHGFPGTSGFRAALGPVLRFAPTREDSNAFNPLFEVRRGANEVRDVQNIVEIILDPGGDTRHQDFWDRSAKQVLTGVILHVLYTEPAERKNLAVVREHLAVLDATAEKMRSTLHRLNPRTRMPEVHPEVLHAARSYLSGEERLRSGIRATSESFFGLFGDPILAERTSNSDFRIGDLMAGARPVTLYLQPPPSDTARLMPLMRLVLNQIARALMEDQAHDAQGRAKNHTLLLLLDEFPQLGRMPFFETAMGAMAGYGLKAYLVCQSFNHISRAYGRDNVIIDNCGIVTAFAASDMDTAKRIAEMAGETWELRPQESEHRPPALLGPRKGAVTFREERRPLLLPGDVRSLPRDQQLVFVSGAKPLKSKKLRFDAEPVFAKRLRPAAQSSGVLSRDHDWLSVAALGRLTGLENKRSDKTQAREMKRVTFADDIDSDGQVDLFASRPKISDLASAGFRDADGAPLPHPSTQSDASNQNSAGDLK